MVRNGGRARRLVAAVAGALLLAGLVPARGLAEAVEVLGAPQAQHGGALEVVDDGPADDTLEVADDGPADDAPVVVEEDSVVAAAQAEGTIGTAQYTLVNGVLRVSGGSFTWTDWYGSLRVTRTSAAVVFANTAVIGDANGMFSNFKGLVSVDASGLDVSSATDMSEMFSGCSALTNLNLSGWDTGSVTNMSNMFYNCSSLTSLDLSGWNTRNVERMDSMFFNCSSLETVWVGAGWDTQAVTSSMSMFYRCTSLKGGAGTVFNGSNPTDQTYAHVDGGTGDPGYLTLASGHIGTSPYSFSYGALRVGAGSFTNDQWIAAVGTIGKGNIKSVAFTDAAVTGSGDRMFDELYRLVSVEAAGLDVSGVEDMSYMFQNCYSLTELDLSGWNTASVTDMDSMFIGCSTLKTINGLSGWDTAKVTNMNSMFSNCTSLASLDLSGWDTAGVTTMSRMFFQCNALATLDGLSEWETRSVTKMGEMFSDCFSLTTLDLSGWDTGSVTNMSNMFYSCSSLTELDLSGWDTGSVTNMSYMFCDCSSLEAVWAGPGWSTGNVAASEDMFYGCTRLKGGAGTAYDAGQTDAGYAHVDGGTGDPGYLTEGPVFRGCYLVLSGDIGVTFTLAAPPSLDAEGVRVGFRVGGREVADAPLSDFETDGSGRYLLRCGTTSLEMAEDVVVTLRWGEGGSESVSASYSVEDYARYVAGNAGVYGDAAARLAKAINDYGYYAQLWLSREHGFALGEGGDYAKMEEAYAKKYSYDEIKQSVDKYKIQKTLGNSGVKVSYQLHLDSATGISVRVRPDPKNTIRIDRSKLSGTLEGDGASGDAVVTGPQQSDGSYVVRLDGIPAHRLADWFRVSGETNKDVFSAGVCALSYVRTVYWTSGYSNAAKDAMAALLEYYDATVNYRDSEGVTA